MKKVLLSILLIVLFTFGMCISVNASDMGHGYYTYVNPIYQDYLFPQFNADSTQSYDSQSSAEIIFHPSKTEAGEELLAGMLNREAAITIGYQTADTSEDFVYAIFQEAVRHTNVSNAGDYLMYNLSGFQCDYSFYTTGVNTCFSITYYPQYMTTAEQEAELDAEIDRILALLNVADANEYEKSTAIYDYICANVAYDYENLNDPTHSLKYTAYAALIDGTAVCQGYATLYYRMALELGLDARVITGIGNNQNHAWNIVRMQDRYYNLDATWDAESAMQYQYYLKSEANFPDHQRSPEMLTAEFQAAHPMSAQDYALSQLKGTCGDDLIWTMDMDGTLTISGNGKMEDYGYVSEDGTGYTYYEKPWEPWGAVKKLIIEKGVTSVGFAAFINQAQLEEVVFHNNSVTEIGAYAFAGSGIKNPVVFPDSLLKIDDYAFEGSSIPGTVSFGSNLESVGMMAFAECSSITGLSFPKSLQAIGFAAFYECSSLKTVKFAGTPPEIANLAFANTDADLTFMYSEGTADWTTPTWTAEDGTVYNTVLMDAGEAQPSIVDTGVCGDNATWTLYNNNEVIIRGTGAMSMVNLGLDENQKVKVIIDEGITEIGECAFNNVPTCWNVVSVSIPASVTEIGAEAFAGCVYMQEILFGSNSNIVSIGEEAFRCCYDLTEILLPDSLTYIGDGAFMYCIGLGEIIIPAGVSVIGMNAFVLCNDLKKIIVHENNQYYSSDENGVLFDKDQAKILRYPAGKTDTVYTFPETVTVIGYGSFAHSEHLLEITIPDHVETIEDQAFSGCNSVHTIRIGSGLKHLISSVPGSGYAATVFRGESLLRFEVDEANTSFSTDEYGVLFDKEKTVLIQYPIAADWKYYQVPSSVEDIRLFSFFNALKLEAVTLPQNLKSIGQEAFARSGIREVELPGTLTYLSSSFTDCPNLKKITIRKSTSDVDIFIRLLNGLFKGNYHLEEIFVEDGHIEFYSVDSVLYSNYAGHSLVQYPIGRKDAEYTIKEGTQVLEEWSFAGTSYLKHLTIPKSVKLIRARTFYTSPSITDITVLSKDAVFEQDAILNPSPSLVLHGYKGSTTEAYALQNGICFEVIEEPLPLTGDITGDSTVDIRDAQRLFQYSMLPDIYPIDYTGNVDFNGDGAVDIRDAQRLFQYSMLPDIYPIS